MFAKLARIAEAETERLRRWVYVIHALFERHFSEQLMSAKGLPVVGPEELGNLMTEGLSLSDNPSQVFSPPTESELIRFVKFMDNDKDGLIDEQELICFCVKGLRQTPEANLAFASRSPMHAKLIGFLEAVNSFAGVDEQTDSGLHTDNVVPPKRDSNAAREDLAQYRQSETRPAAAPAQGTPVEDNTQAATPSSQPAPAETAPAEAAPTEAAPAESTPAESAPAESAPAESAPAEAAPAEAAPAEAAPAEAAPAENTSNPTASESAQPSQ